MAVYLAVDILQSGSKWDIQDFVYKNKMENPA